MSLVRQRLPELMDQADLETAQHRQALKGLSRINWWSLTDIALWQALDKFQPTATKTPLRILDVACGGGDVAIRLARRARLQSCKVEVRGIDSSAAATDYASEKARIAGLKTVSFQTLNVFEERLPEGYDVIISTLFLHHLEPPRAIDLLQRMASAARRAILIDDLRPTLLGYAMAWCACRTLSRSAIVHNDGPISVRAAYTPEEAIELANRAGLPIVQVQMHWPQRYLLVWRRP